MVKNGHRLKWRRESPVGVATGGDSGGIRHGIFPCRFAVVRLLPH